MKRFLLFSFLCLLGQEVLAAQTVQIVPHRAIYKMSLGKVKNGSAISDASGTMLFDWSDTCDGWVVQQHMKLHFNYAEGEEGDIDSTVVTWEAKDGSKYNFNVRRLSGGQEDEIYRGRATIDEKGGVVFYTVPKDKKEAKLLSDTIFPSAHTKLIIEKALAREKLFTRPVFDGSDEAGYAHVSAFIGKKIEQPQKKEKNPELQKNPLLNQPAWPIRLAFFSPLETSGEPDYEMDLVLQANGVARAMTIDYGDFSVVGVLAKVEPATAFSCLEP